jgi:hypothetical protein
MNLDDAQRKKVSAWIAEGAKLSEIQNKLAAEFGLRLTYIDVRFLVDDLKLTPQDAEPPKAPAAPLVQSTSPASALGTPSKETPTAEPLVPSGNPSISVDQIARPGTVVSGTVTFADGQKADWYLDQTGRLGLAPQQTGYRPAPEAVQQFQLALEKELSKLGFA